MPDSTDGEAGGCTNGHWSREDLDKIRARLVVVERGGRMEEYTTAIRTLQMKVKALEYRVEDAENRSRRNNLRIESLAEGAEGVHPTTFVEDLLRSLLPAAQLPPYFVVERAHRVPPQRVPPGSPPRTMILRLLNFRD